MITTDNRIIEENFVNLTDYSLKCPKELRSWFTFIDFTDRSSAMLSNIFAKDRAGAMLIVLERFADCIGYIQGISLQSCDGEN